VALSPRIARSRPDHTTAQQQLADPVARGHQVAAQVLARADQIAQRLEFGLGNHDGPKLPRGVQPGELERIAGVGLDAVTRLARDRARSAHHHLDAGRPCRPRQAEPGRPGLIDSAHRPRQRPQPADRLGRPPGQPRAKHLPRPEHDRGRRGLARMNIQTGKADTVGHVDAPHPSMR
jgi:hypothetical protein